MAAASDGTRAHQNTEEAGTAEERAPRRKGLLEGRPDVEKSSVTRQGALGVLSRLCTGGKL